jgi:hypothetical protein
MEAYEGRCEGNAPRPEVRTSFFTRRLAGRFQGQGQPIPPAVMVFLDTPLCAMNDKQRAYFENKFCSLIPTLASMLEEVYIELGADTDGWEDMITYCGDTDTPVMICARAVLARKEKEEEANNVLRIRPGLETKRIQLPSEFADAVS